MLFPHIHLEKLIMFLNVLNYNFGQILHIFPRICCVSIQGLHPSKDSAFAVFEGESFRETLFTVSADVKMGRSRLWSISWLRHKMF